MVEDVIAAVLPYAAGRGVRLAIEPLQSMYAGDRSIIVTLGQANAMSSAWPRHRFGVAIDVFPVWWDPKVYTQITLAAGHILGIHVSDWPVPLPDVLLGRGLMGDGVFELPRLRAAAGWLRRAR